MTIGFISDFSEGVGKFEKARTPREFFEGKNRIYLNRPEIF